MKTIKSQNRGTGETKRLRHKLPCFSLTLIGAAFAGILYMGSSIAATDGELGPSSTGTMNISVIVQDGVRIHQMQDIYAAVNQNDTVNQANAKLPSVDACVYSTSGAYTLRAENRNGSQAGYATLRGANGNLPYQLAVNDNHGNRYQQITQQPTQMHLRTSSDYNCSDGKNLHIAMQLADGAQLKPDHYTDVVNLMVAPE